MDTRLLDVITMQQATTCPDFHRCYYGSTCVEHPSNQGGYSCDCGAIPAQEGVFAGLACEHQATVYCNSDNHVDALHFCTNGGTCVRTVNYETDDPQLLWQFAGCTCPEEYKGDHCEYVENQMIPEDWPEISISTIHNVNDGQSNDNDEKKPTAAIVTTLLVLALIALGSFVVIRRRRKQFQNSNSNGTDLTLEADGSVLHDAIKQKGTMDTSPLEEEEPTPSDSDSEAAARVV